MIEAWYLSQLQIIQLHDTRKDIEDSETNNII